jgi:hypothetical protein
MSLHTKQEYLAVVYMVSIVILEMYKNNEYAIQTIVYMVCFYCCLVPTR